MDLRAISYGAAGAGARVRAIQAQQRPQAGLNVEEIAALVDQLGDMITVLKEADPEHKMEVYRSLGLKLTYDPQQPTILSGLIFTDREADGC